MNSHAEVNRGLGVYIPLIEDPSLDLTERSDLLSCIQEFLEVLEHALIIHKEHMDPKYVTLQERMVTEHCRLSSVIETIKVS